MTVEELMRLALSPFIFSRLVSEEGEGRLPEVQTRIFSPRLRRSESISELRSLHLIPGGRYLLTYHTRHVCMWDLGYGRVAAAPFPIAVLHLSVNRVWYGEKPPCPTKDGKGVCLMVHSG
jgi:hypothetical protein